MSEDSDQEKVRKFVKDPKTIKKAVESSMDKRAAKLYLEEVEEIIGEAKTKEQVYLVIEQRKRLKEKLGDA